MLKYETSGGKQTFKPVDPKVLFDFVGVSAGWRYEPVMAEQFYLSFDTEDAADEAERKLSALAMDDGRTVLQLERDGDRQRLYGGCGILVRPADDAEVKSPWSNRAAPFHRLFYPAQEHMKSGMHHPDGMFWVRTPQRRRRHVERKISLLEVAPTLLALCGINAPGHLAPPPGRGGRGLTQSPGRKGR